MISALMIQDLLKQSALSIGFYKPTPQFKQYESVGITINDKVLMLVGWAEDEDSHRAANELLMCNEFIAIVKHQLGEFIARNGDYVLSKQVINNRILKDVRYSALVASEQGVLEERDNQESELVALILIEDAQVFSVLLAINNAIMKIFKPTANNIPQVNLIK